MGEQSLQALVVDDDPVARKMVGFALSQEGFGCAYAADGNEALDRLAEQSFDVVVTDLRMPNRHGHSLAMELLSRQTRPLIVVHSSVDDPRLTKDLMVKGVDDVVYKPTNYDAFAAKVAGMLKSTRSKPPKADKAEFATEDNEPETSQAVLGGTAIGDISISLSELEAKLADVSKVLPISQAAIDIYEMVLTNTFDVEQVAVALHQDQAFAERILQLANIPFYNPSGKQITDIKQAVVRIGQKRVGELALAMRAFSMIVPESLPWMNLDLAWRRSIAAGLAVELLVAQGNHSDVSEGLLFSALMHNAGRIVLGTHYPDCYAQMVKLCLDHNEELVQHETRTFPKNHAEVIVDLLNDWELPAQLFEPLRFITVDYPALSQLAEPTRRKSELIRLAILIGQIAVGVWEDWDSIDFPTTSVLDRLRIADIQAVVEQTKIQMRGIETLYIHSSSSHNLQSPVKTVPPRIDYCNLSPDRFDFLVKMLPSMGLVARPRDARQGTSPGNILVNHVSTKPDKRSSQLFQGRDKILFVHDRSNIQHAGNVGSNISVPCSYSSLRSACWALYWSVSRNPEADRTTAHV